VSVAVVIGSTMRFRCRHCNTPGHCPGHICLFEPEKKWVVSGDLYIAAYLDSQLRDAADRKWIASLEAVIKTEAR